MAPSGWDETALVPAHAAHADDGSPADDGSGRLGAALRRPRTRTDGPRSALRRPG
ncbi:hypothetical protein [Streptomyces sp. NPDC012616]|uniref:hypothetical protein n=1 Tax=Streptomyces sp. NPDC012616 TaxID=3364840 RepID=UPI0036ECCE32